MRDDFAVFILSHGRADRVYTVKTLLDGGYTGKWYIIIDNEDDQEAEYRKLYGDHIIQFDKKAQDARTDTADTVRDRRSVVYARNACFDIAEQIGVTYFLQLDDDYSAFNHRWIEGKKLACKTVKDLDRLFTDTITFFEDSGALTVAYAQGGDFIGGVNSGTFRKKVLRKAMNSFFCSTERRFEFVGRINEDVNMYTLLGTQGKLILTITDISITQKQTQSNAGGWTEVYLERGTYVKSFYSVIYAPSCVQIATMGQSHLRIHHSVEWENCAAKILNERHRKGAGHRGAAAESH